MGLPCCGRKEIETLSQGTNSRQSSQADTPQIRRRDRGGGGVRPDNYVAEAPSGSSVYPEPETGSGPAGVVAPEPPRLPVGEKGLVLVLPTVPANPPSVDQADSDIGHQPERVIEGPMKGPGIDPARMFYASSLGDAASEQQDAVSGEEAFYTPRSDAQPPLQNPDEAIAVQIAQIEAEQMFRDRERVTQIRGHNLRRAPLPQPVALPYRTASSSRPSGPNTETNSGVS